MFRNSLLVFALLALLPWEKHACATQLIELSPTDGDMASVVRKAMGVTVDRDIKIVFTKGVYRFEPKYAFEEYCAITNHGNGLKKIAFPFKGFDSVTIEGNGAELIFHGQMMPFLFEQCSKVTVSDLTIDWDIPFTFLGEVVACNPEEQWRDIKPFTKGFSWKVDNGQLQFPNVDGFNYLNPGSTLAFDAQSKRVIHGALDFESHPRRVEQRGKGILRFHEDIRQYSEVGTLLSSKGDREHDRYAPAFHVKSSSNVYFRNLTVHHALGMGFLMERTDTATLSNCGVFLREGTDRVISSTADATHFCNCRGDVIVENCRFENMLDDGTNVHGTYVEVDQVLDEHTVRVQLKHFEQSGFIFAESGDKLWFIHQPDPSRATGNEVVSATPINGRYIDLKLKEPLPDRLKVGDIIENKTWNPVFTMRGCTIRNHRARNVVLKSPLKTVIEENDFSSMMSSIFFRGETFFWFESGAVQDVVIRNNRFNYCAYSGMEHSVLYITPRLGAEFDSSITFDRNIRFENNVINTFDQRIVWADRVDGLVISGNKITQTDSAEQLHPDAAVFDLKFCRNVKIHGNHYNGSSDNFINADAITQKSLSVSDNQGF